MVEMGKMIKATNLAKGVEISKEGGRIRFVAHFDEDTTATRIVPAIVLWRAWFASKWRSFAKELVYYSEHQEIVQELPKLCRLLSEGQAEVRVEYVTLHASMPPTVIYTENDETINIQPWADKAKIFFGPPIEGSDLITVPKDELVKTLEQLLQ